MIVFVSFIVKNVANISSPFNSENNASEDLPNVRNYKEITFSSHHFRLGGKVALGNKQK